MTLQNRVDPFGNIIKTLERGTFMGNRGLLHNNKKEICRSYKTNAWITCLLAFKGRRRVVMAPGKYTELFFMDEATSFAAGHRPCFECRRGEADVFKSHWLNGNAAYGLHAQTSIKEIDKVLHKERITKNKVKLTFEEPLVSLPNGTFVIWGNEPYLIKDGAMYAWSSAGYGKAISFPLLEKVAVLTPKSIVNAFKNGYIPQMAV